MADGMSDRRQRAANKYRAMHTGDWYTFVGDALELKCCGCGISGRAADLFYRCAAHPRGFSSRCKHCRSIIDSADKCRRRYGVSRDVRREMWERQGCQCLVCGTPLQEHAGCIDHDHRSGGVRGILCADCNIALGRLHDSIPSLQNAVRYLRRGAAAIYPESRA